MRQRHPLAHRKQVDRARQVLDASSRQRQQAGIESMDGFRSYDPADRVHSDESRLQVATPVDP